MEIKNIRIQKPEEINFILGQSHFIKTVEDIHEVLVSSVPGIKFGLAFVKLRCLLVRWSGTDDAMINWRSRMPMISAPVTPSSSS